MIVLLQVWASFAKLYISDIQNSNQQPHRVQIELGNYKVKTATYNCDMSYFQHIYAKVILKLVLSHTKILTQIPMQGKILGT